MVPLHVCYGKEAVSVNYMLTFLPSLHTAV